MPPVKKNLFILFSFFIQFGFAQNWELFPPSQRSFYTASTISDSFEIAAVNEFIDDGISSIFKFDAWGFYGLSNDCIHAVEFAIDEGSLYCDHQKLNEFPFIDSIVVRNDTSFIYSGSISYSMYFLEESQAGDTWNILQPGMEDVLIECTGIMEELIFGITDSVKIFTFSEPGAGMIDGLQIKLSKNFGLIQFVDFNFLANYDGSGVPPVYYLEGFSDEDISEGFYLPDYEDYFGYAEGDILMWRRDVSNIDPFSYVNYFEYYRDSIISKIIYTDSIVYHFDRLKKDTADAIISFPDQKVVFERAGFDPLLLAHPDFIGFANNQYGNYFTEYQTDIWCMFDIIYTAGVKPEIERSFGTGVNRLDTYADCLVWSIADIGYGLTMQTNIGITNYNKSVSKSDDSWFLIGYYINGELFGDVDIFTVTIENNEVENFEINPNPAVNIIQIGEGDFKNGCIYDLNGRLVMKEEIINGFISIENLIPGIYILELKNDNQTLRGKFIKQ